MSANCLREGSYVGLFVSLSLVYIMCVFISVFVMVMLVYLFS
jgi:hypothetical protein